MNPGAAWTDEEIKALWGDSKVQPRAHRAAEGGERACNFL